MKPITSPKIIEALQGIAKEHNGVLSPAAVVEYARPKSSPLHSRFTWDNTEAARLYRLVEARSLISVVIRYIDDGVDRVPVRVFVSLSKDREKKGGYRHIVDVVKDSDMRAMLISDAKEDMRRFEERYANIKELVDVIRAMRNARKELA